MKRPESRQDLMRDLRTGLVIGFLSVPLSAGFAQVAGLPPQYGLYGSLLPAAVFGLLTSSPRCVFGVDAAPAALVASLISELGFTFGSPGAASVMPVITLLTACWLFLFWLLRGGRFAKFISEPVLGGCVSGISCVAILAELPGLFGGTPSHGRAPTLFLHLFHELPRFHPLSFLLGVLTIAVILTGRRKVKTSLSVMMALAGILMNMVFPLERLGVASVGPIPPGLPRLPVFDAAPLRGHWESILLHTLAVALVIAAETLVTMRNVGRKYHDRMDNQKELLAYAASNLAAALCGSSPVSGSISRTNRANRRGVKSQWMSISAPLATVSVLLFGLPALSRIPTPILTGIVIAALITMLEFPMAVRLWKLDRSQAFIFAAAFAAELLGLSEGVIVGVVLSFVSFTIRAAAHTGCFLGCLEGEEGFFDIQQYPQAKPVAETILYQFNGSLFFASMDDFERDLMCALRNNTRLIIVTGITDVDVFAAERLLHFYRELRQRGISLYLAGHALTVQKQLIAYGAQELVRENVIQQRLTQALSVGGLVYPYPLDDKLQIAVSGEAERQDSDL